MSGVFEGQWTQSSPANIPGDLYIGGDITVVGSINTGGSGEGQIVDAINTVNYGETGAGVGGAGISGIEVDRGTETNFRFIFDESDDKFKSGLIGSMKVVTHGDVGTQGYIPFGITGGGQLTESANLFWDSGNNRLGLGTSTPAQTLDVKGSAIIETADPSIQFVDTSDAGNGQSIVKKDGGISLTSLVNDFSVFSKRADGFVGINTNAPAYQLDVQGNANVNGNILVTGTVDGVDVAAHKTSYDAHVADSSIHFTEASIDHANILNIGTNTHAQIDTAITNSTNHIADSSIHFTVASIDHGSIAGLGDDDHTQYALVTGARAFTGGVTVNTGGVSVTGNSGFGIAAASAFGNLHIRSGVSGVASAPIAGDEFIIEGSGSSGMTILSGLAGGGHILFGDSGDNDAGFIRYTHGTDVLDFGVNGLGTVMTIDNTGDVGIGVASPTERLDVSGNIAVSGTVDGVDVSAHAADSTIHFTQASIDHTAILNVGTNTHAQIDTHIADATLHFTQASIDHTAILNVGTNTHAQIDTHIADATVHFTEASIDHGSIAGLGDDDHTQYALADGTRAFTDAVTINNTTFNPGANTDTALVLQGGFGGGLKFEDTNNAGMWVDNAGTRMHFTTGKTTAMGGTGEFQIEQGAIRVPNGTTAQRPSQQDGHLRVNTSLAKLETHLFGQWSSIAESTFRQVYVSDTGSGNGSGLDASNAKSGATVFGTNEFNESTNTEYIITSGNMGAFTITSLLGNTAKITLQQDTTFGSINARFGSTIIFDEATAPTHSKLTCGIITVVSGASIVCPSEEFDLSSNDTLTVGENASIVIAAGLEANIMRLSDNAVVGANYDETSKVTVRDLAMDRSSQMRCYDFESDVNSAHNATLAAPQILNGSTLTANNISCRGMNVENDGSVWAAGFIDATETVTGVGNSGGIAMTVTQKSAVRSSGNILCFGLRIQLGSDVYTSENLTNYYSPESAQYHINTTTNSHLFVNKEMKNNDAYVWSGEVAFSVSQQSSVVCGKATLGVNQGDDILISNHGSLFVRNSDFAGANTYNSSLQRPVNVQHHSVLVSNHGLGNYDAANDLGTFDTNFGSTVAVKNNSVISGDCNFFFTGGNVDVIDGSTVRSNRDIRAALNVSCRSGSRYLSGGGDSRIVGNADADILSQVNNSTNDHVAGSRNASNFGIIFYNGGVTKVS